MTSVSIAVLSAAEFEVARRLMSELSAHPSYDDWVDCRYGAFMGRSLGGDAAQLVTVDLGPFLEWCEIRGLRPTESALDAFALHLTFDRGASQEVSSSELSPARPAHLTERKPTSISLPLSPKRESRSIAVDL